MRFHVKNLKVAGMALVLIISSNHQCTLCPVVVVTCVTIKQWWVQWPKEVKVLWTIWVIFPINMGVVPLHSQLVQVWIMMIYSNTFCNTIFQERLGVRLILRRSCRLDAITKTFVLSLIWMNGAFLPDCRITKQKK